MRCAAIMTAAPPTVHAGDSVAEAVGKLIRERHSSLPVVDGDGRYVGMFGPADVLSLLVPRVAIAGHLAPNVRFVADDPKPLEARFRAVRDRSVGEVADRNAVVLAPETPQIEAFRIFCRGHVALPVVEPASGKLVGVVSYWDVMAAITDGA